MKALELLPYHARPGVHKASAVVAPSKLLKSAAVETGDLLHVDGQHLETPFSLSHTHTHTLSLSLSLCVCVSLSLSLSSLSLSLSLTHTHTGAAKQRGSKRQSCISCISCCGSTSVPGFCPSETSAPSSSNTMCDCVYIYIWALIILYYQLIPLTLLTLLNLSTNRAPSTSSRIFTTINLLNLLNLLCIIHVY